MEPPFCILCWSRWILLLSSLELGSIRGTEPALIPPLFGEDQSPVKDRTRETAEIEPTLELVFQSTHCLREYTGVEFALPFVLHFTPHILEMLWNLLPTVAGIDSSCRNLASSQTLCFPFRACLHGGGGLPIGEITCFGLPHRSGLPYLPGLPHLHVNRPLVRDRRALVSK